LVFLFKDNGNKFRGTIHPAIQDGRADHEKKTGFRFFTFFLQQVELLVSAAVRQVSLVVSSLLLDGYVI
jgi:hypothetical protein